MRNIIQTVVKWLLGLHGMLYVVEFFVYLLEGTYWSASINLFSGLLMITGGLLLSRSGGK